MRRFFKSWVKREDGIAAVEAALIFPIMLTLMLATFDMGTMVLTNQKTIRASQIGADLITRERTVSTSDIDEAVDASELALQPYDTDSFGIDIVSIRFDEDSNAEIVWRETRNMSPKEDVLSDVEALASANSGVVVVTTEYDYEPTFSGFLIGDVTMEETAFARGRKSAVVNQE